MFLPFVSLSNALAGEVFVFKDPASGETLITLKQDNTVVKATTRGANVYSINVAGVEYLVNRAVTEDFKDIDHGTPVLYPVPNRLRNATFTHEGRRIQFSPNFYEHRLHGLVFDQPWQVLGTRADERAAGVTFALTFAEGSELFRQFPFVHRLLLDVRVTDNRVRLEYTVDNSDGRKEVPFGFGLHPMFLYQGQRDQTFLSIPATHMMEAEREFPTGALIPAEKLDFPLGQPFAIGDRQFDTAFFRESGESTALIEFRDAHRKIRIRQSDDFSHVVVWTPDFGVLSVENQTSSTDAPNLRAAGFDREAHWQVCPPGDTRSGWVEYEFSGLDDFASLNPEAFKLSQIHCASCHGLAFLGARTPSLTNGEWRHAESAAALPGIINSGIPSVGMPAFADVLTDAEIESLANFIVDFTVTYPEKMAAIAAANTGQDRIQSNYVDLRIETVCEGLRIPWSMAFLPDGRLLVSEREGALRVIDDGVIGDPIRGTPAVWAKQDGGLLAIALDSDYAANRWVYLSLADPGAEIGTSMTKLIRGRIVEGEWKDEQVIWQAPQSCYRENNSHYGTRLAFHDGKLFFSVGDRGSSDDAQDLSLPMGKIHRILSDGGIPPDNPFADDPNAWPSIWSYGHRNPQGFSFVGDELWATEHGPFGGDELNWIQRGGNFGWPEVTFGIDDSREESQRAPRPEPGMINPVLVWQPSFAPSALLYYDQPVFPHWRGQFLVGSLAGQELRRVKIVDHKAVEQELLFKNLGRIRDLQIGPDGHVYIALERFNRLGCIVRLVPVSDSP